MSALGRDIERVMIVDNSILAFAYHLNNGVPIPSFYGQPWDTEFPILVEILDGLRIQNQVSP